MKQSKIIDFSNVTNEQLLEILLPLRGHDVEFLSRIATDLKQNFGGEGWAVGEVIERVIRDATKVYDIPNFNMDKTMYATELDNS